MTTETAEPVEQDAEPENAAEDATTEAAEPEEPAAVEAAEENSSLRLRTKRTRNLQAPEILKQWPKRMRRSRKVSTFR